MPERQELVEAADRLLSEREAAVTTTERLVGDVKPLVEAVRDLLGLITQIERIATMDDMENFEEAVREVADALKPFEEGERG